MTGHYIPHIPVMLHEMLKCLAPKDNEIYLDATFGAGGYSRGILEYCDCSVVAVDQDPEVEIYAKELQEKYHSKFKFIKSNFVSCSDLLKNQKFNGIVLDLGVSSMQIDQGSRGFSFSNDGPLDMRMSKTGISAADFINNATEEEIAHVICKYGEENASRRIAKAIVTERALSPIITSIKLANIVRSICKVRGKIDAATKTFQGIRIHINKELENLEIFLSDLRNMMEENARVVILSFHSLEDRIVKNFIKDNSPKKQARSKYSKNINNVENGKWLRAFSYKPMIPTALEIKLNPRSRSAKLRWAIKEEIYAN